MFIWLAALGLLFVQPAYYRLKANGYPAQPYIPITIAIAGCCLLATCVYPLAIFGSLIASVGLYLFACTRLPKRRRTRGWLSSDHLRMPLLSSTGYVSQTKGGARCPLPKVP